MMEISSPLCETRNKWTCSFCSLRNNNAALQCEACDESKQQSLDGQSSMNNDEILLNRDHNGNVITTDSEFRKSASEIAIKNSCLFSIFDALISVINKMMINDDIRYRMLDSTNTQIMDTFFANDEVLNFLLLLGFEADATKTKLVCDTKPSINIVRNAINVLVSYQLRFGVGTVRISKDEDEKYKELNKQFLKLDEVVVFGYVHQYNPLNINIPNQVIKLFALFYYEKKLRIKKIHDDDYDDDRLSIQDLVEWAADHYNILHHETMKTIIITHKLFTDSMSLIKCFRKIFTESISTEIRLNVLKSLSNWMMLYWEHDFIENDAVKMELKLWLKHELLNQNIMHHSLFKALISSISTRFNRLEFSKSTDNKNKENGVTMIDEKKRMDDELLVFGYIRNSSIRNKLNELIKVFFMFYHEIIEVPKQFILSELSAKDIADQITLIDKYMFNKIGEREFLNGNYKIKDKQKLSPNILNMMQQFNGLTIFIEIEILKQKTVSKRCLTIQRMIKIGQRLREINNFHSLCAVFVALNSAPIHRLKIAWNRVPKKYRETLDEFGTLFTENPRKLTLYRILRVIQPPYIPWTGICLRDFLFVDDGSSITTNINKLVYVIEKIKNLKSKTEPYDKKIKQNLIIQKAILIELEKLKDITEDEIWDFSTEIKKQDERATLNKNI